MKVAVVISGQLRTWKLCKHFLKNMILDKHDCDVFLSIDTNNKTQLLYKNNRTTTEKTEISEIIDFYHPISYFINDNDNEKKIDEIVDKIVDKIPIGKAFGYEMKEEEKKCIYKCLINQESQYLKDSLKINDVYFKSPTAKKLGMSLNRRTFYLFIRQYYYLGKAYELLKKHITKTGTKYDLVIRIRFDHIVWNDEFHNKELCKFDKATNQDIRSIKYTEKNIQLSEILTQGKEVLLDTSEVNTIKVLGGGVIKNYTYVNDFFWTHGHDLIDKMTLFGEELKDIMINSTKTSWPLYGAPIEHFLSVFLFNKNINIKPTIMNRMWVVREL